MNKKFFIGLAVVLVVAVAAVGYWYYQKSQKGEPDAVDLGKQASQGVLPSIDLRSNPMENAPDTNPLSKTNPFSEIKTNPFSAEGGSASGGE